MGLRFLVQIETIDGWLYLSRNANWSSTTIHEKMRYNIDNGGLTADPQFARFWSRRGRDTSIDRVTRALKTRFPVKVVEQRDIGLTETQRTELRSRLAYHRANPDEPGVTFSQLKEKLLASSV